MGLTLLGAVTQAGVLITRGLVTRRLPWGNVYEFGTAVVLVGVVAFLVMLHRSRESRRLGLFVVGPAAVALVLIGLFPSTAAGPLVAALRSAWLAVHVTAAMVGFGTFMVSGIANALYLFRLRADAAARRTVAGHGLDLPPADRADAGCGRAPHRCVRISELDSCRDRRSDVGGKRLGAILGPAVRFAAPTLFSAPMSTCRWSRVNTDCGTRLSRPR